MPGDTLKSAAEIDRSPFHLEGALNKFGLVVLVAVLCVFVGCPKDETRTPEEDLTPQETVSGRRR